ncbi:MAG: helix-turn-helix domain-containing protein [Puniceicoccales bacterium]|nr:helix-turn-helix domain-containing protein [Puniceicoccales bacterium]
MNENIGVIFSETRQKKGFSLDEVAEALRIRREYIEAMEDGSFNFNLPNIYKRGFYKSYVNFLGLDEEEMMGKCPIRPFETLESSQKRREMVSQVAKKAQMVNHDHIKTSFDDDLDNVSSPSVSPDEPMNRMMMFKVSGVVLGSILLLFFILYGIFSYLGDTGRKGTAEDVREFIEKKVVIRSSGEVKVMVRDGEDKSKIFSGVLKKGDEKMVSYKKPIQIYFNRGESLVIEMDNGEHLHPDSGRGGLQIK